MAIVFEEKGSSINWASLSIGILIVVMVFVGAYYLLFKKPELIEVVAPKNLENISSISSLTFNPETVISHPVFQKLKPGGAEPTPPSPGRSNPFRPF